MHCSTVRTWLPDYVETSFRADNLTSQQRDAVERHLRLCPRCARELDLLYAVIRRLRTLPEVEPPATLWQGVAAQTAKKRLARLWGAGVVVACIAILWATLLPQWTGTPHDTGPPAFKPAERPPSQPLPQPLVPQVATLQRPPGAILQRPPLMSQMPSQEVPLPPLPRHEAPAQNSEPTRSPQAAPSAQAKPQWVTDKTCGGRGWIPCPGPAGWTTVSMAVKCEGGKVVCLLHFGDNCPICNDWHGKTCPVCKGTGRIVCPVCKGTGKVLATPIPHPHLSDELPTAP